MVKHQEWQNPGVDNSLRGDQGGFAPLAVGFLLFVVGIVVGEFFNYRFGTVLAALGVVPVVYSLVVGRSRRIVASTAAVILLLGVVWILANRGGPDAASPSLESVADDAGEYARVLAEGDFEAYQEMVDHTFGATVEEAFRVESTCIDWTLATVSVAPNEVSPTIVYVTFSDGASSLVRDFQYTSGHWVPTVDDSC